MKTICIAGKNDIAVDVLLYCMKRYRMHRIICVTNRNETGINSWQRSLKWFAQKNDIEILSLEETYNIEELLFLSLEYDRIIVPSRFVNAELYNIHFSMLPKYKGCFPAVLPILNGEMYSGVTLHVMRKGIDTGEIIKQKEVPINQDDTSLDLYRKLIHAGTEVVIEELDALLTGEINVIPQSKVGATYFSRDTIDYTTLGLDTNKTAYQIQCQIRAFNFRPYQILSWCGRRYVECVILDETSVKKPGAVIEETDIYTKIATIDYDVILYKDVFEDLLEAIKRGDNENAKRMCISKKIVEAKDSHGWTALTVAVYNNNIEMVKFLVENGADIDVINNNGTTLLMYAKDCYVNYGDARMFEYLLNKGVSLEKTDYSGKSLYDYCVEEKVVCIGNFDMNCKAN